MKKKILLSAYACEPEVGSEHALGWGWVNFLTKNSFEVEVITRKSNKKRISYYLKKKKIKNIKFHYFDLDGPLYKIFKGKNNSYSYFYFLIWQILIFFKFKNYIKRKNFDYVQHVTFGSLRFPSFLGLCNKNFIFGPVAGYETIPENLNQSFTFKEKVFEKIRLISNSYINHSPFMKMTFNNSKKIIVSSKKNFQKLPKKYHKKTIVIFATRLIKKISKKPIDIKKNYNDEILILFVGRLLYWKGINILLKTFKNICDSKSKKKFKLLIRGNGPKYEKMKNFIVQNNLDNKVIFINKQKNLKKLYSRSSLFFFPSLRETGGMSLLEAMSVGIPPAVINNGGPGQIVTKDCGIVVNTKNKNENQVINSFSKKILKLSLNPVKASKYSKNSHLRINNFIWNKKLLKIYN